MPIPATELQPPHRVPALNETTGRTNTTPPGPRRKRTRAVARPDARPPKRARTAVNGPHPFVHGVGPIPSPADPLLPAFGTLDGKPEGPSEAAATDVWYFMVPAPAKEKPAGWTKPDVSPNREKPNAKFIICRLCW